MKIITIKPHTYQTRQLVAGDEYDLPTEQAVLLVMDGKAQFSCLTPQSQRPKVISLDDLREEATKLGINVDRRWGKVRLQYEITQAQS
jgi:hypothetical protein